MAKLSELMTCVAGVTGIPESDVRQFGRRAREAGYIAQGARGNAAPDMGPTDAANLLIAILGAEYAKDAPDVIARYRSLKSEFVSEDGTPSNWINYGETRDCIIKPKILSWFEREHTFGEALEYLIERAMLGYFDKKSPSIYGSIPKFNEPSKIADAYACFEYGNLWFVIEANKTTNIVRIDFYDADSSMRVVCGSVAYNGHNTKANYDNVRRIYKDVIGEIGKLLKK